MTDVAVVGGGLVGLATAARLAALRPGLRLVLLEKETGVARHQSGRNSGVLHAGVYYRPGSRKAALCRAGKAALEAFCDAEGLPWRRCGKLIVAVDEAELPALRALAARAEANGVSARWLGPEALREVEPHAAGVAALHVHATGVADFGAVAERLRARLRRAGADVRTGTAVVSGREGRQHVTLETTRGVLEARVVVGAAGLFADRLARALGHEPGVALVPFRGEYAVLRPEAAAMVRALIYPVPDPAFPFLGVHLTRTVHGVVEAGPSAALAFAREGYRLGTFHARDLAETLGARGFRRLAARHWRMGASELSRSVSLTAFWRAARRLLPGLGRDDLMRGPSGVRAQAVFPDGSLADDFVLGETGRCVHVLNAPSPAATACLAVGDAVAQRALARL
ncbi:MAG: L-2-hydroxyglutarate oxidase [Rubricoccaceae bacterium]